MPSDRRKTSAQGKPIKVAVGCAKCRGVYADNHTCYRKPQSHTAHLHGGTQSVSYREVRYPDSWAQVTAEVNVMDVTS